MKEGWTYKKLPDISENLDSIRKPVTKSNRITGIYPYYGASGIVDYVDDYLFDENLLCISEDGANLLMRTYPIAFPISGKVWVNNHAHVLRFKNMATQKYVEYFFAGTKIDEYVTGAAQPKLTQKALNNISIKMPNSIEEQQRIVSRLDAAFAHIDELKANAEKQLSEARTLFQKALTKAMEPKEGWAEKRIDEVCSIARGGSPRPIKDYITNDPNGLNWIKIGDTDMGGKYIYSTKEKIKPEGLKKSRWVEEDEFLLSNSMSFGRPYILKTNGCIHDGWLVLRDYQKYLDIDFFYYVLSSEFVQKQFRTKAQGSTVSNLNTDRVASVTIPVPSLSEQHRIVSRLDSLSAHVRELEEVLQKTIAECDALKQALLRKVFD